MPTYLLALMVVPPSAVPMAFQSLLRGANRLLTTTASSANTIEPGTSHGVDPWLCVSRLARPFPDFDCISQLALPLLARAAANARRTGASDPMLNRYVSALCVAGNLQGLETCYSLTLIDPASLESFTTAASAAGHAHVVEWWIQTYAAGAPDGRLPGELTHDNVKAACRSGSIAVGDMWVAHLRSSLVNLAWSRCWLDMCEAGHAALLTHVHLVMECTLHTSNAELMDAASAYGHVGVLDWFLLHVEKPSYTHQAMDRASANGHLDVLDWWARCGLPLKFTPAGRIDAQAAGHAAVVDWWTSFPVYRTLLCGPLLPGNPKSSLHITDAITLASFGRLAWMQSLAGVKDADDIEAPIMFCKVVTRFGHAHVFQAYLLAVDDGDCVAECLKIAAQYNQVVMWGQLVELLYDGYDDDPDMSALWLACVLAAAEHGAVDVLRILLMNPKTSPKQGEWVQVFCAACKGGSKRVLRNLFDTGYLKKGAMSEDQEWQMFKTAAAHGRVKVLKWLYCHQFGRIGSEEWGLVAGAACAHGHINVLDWMQLTFVLRSFEIQVDDIRAVGTGKHGNVAGWLLAEHYEGNLALSAASIEYLQLVW